MLNPTLERLDEADPHQQKAGVTPTLVMRITWSSYAIALVLTFIFQIVIRLADCAAFVPCAISLGKAVPWSVFWPFYWMFYLNG